MACAVHAGASTATGGSGAGGGGGGDGDGEGAGQLRNPRRDHTLPLSKWMQFDSLDVTSVVVRGVGKEYQEGGPNDRPVPAAHAALVVTRTPACTTSTSRVSATHVPVSVDVAIGEASPTSPTSNSAMKMVHFRSGREAAKPRRSWSSAVLTTAQRCLGIVVRKRSALSLPFRGSSGSRAPCHNPGHAVASVDVTPAKHTSPKGEPV